MYPDILYDDKNIKKIQRDHRPNFIVLAALMSVCRGLACFLLLLVSVPDPKPTPAWIAFSTGSDICAG